MYINTYIYLNFFNTLVTIEGKLDGKMEVWAPGTAYISLGEYNTRLNLPENLITNDIKKVELPNKSNFEEVDPIWQQYRIQSFYGEGLYAKKQIYTTGCADIGNDGVYRNILGTFPDGKQAWYEGHLQLDENTLTNPIADGGAAMMGVTLTNVEYEWDRYPLCPVPFKSFLNGENW